MTVGLGGAEVDIAVLFADVRGSTALGERTSPTEFAGLLNRFYKVATGTLVRHDAVIDKLIGDEVDGVLRAGHQRTGVPAAGCGSRRGATERRRLRNAGGPWLNMGVAVNAGVAYVGNGGGAVIDFTALGDTVDVAARMQGEAAGGELLVREGVSAESAPEMPRRTLNLRGHEEPIEVLVVTA